MSLVLLAFLIGVVAGLRAMTAPAVVSWAAHLGWLKLDGSLLSFLGAAVTPYVFSALALVEFVTDQLPSTPSRKVPVQFATRVVSGAFCGAAIGVSMGGTLLGAIAGAVGAVAGTFGGAEARSRLVTAIGGSDRPIAILEDAVAILLAVWTVWMAA